LSSYVLFVFIHIASAVLLLGTSILGEPAVRAAARRATEPRDVAAFLTVGRPMTVISPVAALLLLGSGAYLASVAHFWTLGWVQVATVFWVVNCVVAVAVVKPALGRVAAEAAASSTVGIGRELDRLRWSKAWTWGVDLLAANDAAVLYLMTLKPGLGGSLAVVVLVNLAVAAGRLVLGIHPSRIATASAMPEGHDPGLQSGAH